MYCVWNTAAKCAQTHTQTDAQKWKHYIRQFHSVHVADIITVMSLVAGDSTGDITGKVALLATIVSSTNRQQSRSMKADNRNTKFNRCVSYTTIPFSSKFIFWPQRFRHFSFYNFRFTQGCQIVLAEKAKHNVFYCQMSPKNAKFLREPLINRSSCRTYAY